MLPLIIDLTGKEIVIVGGGPIAARKANVLLEERAKITFIAPQFSTEVRELAREKGHQLIQRKAIPSDFDGAFLVILATNNRTVNQTLAATLSPYKLVCVVDEGKDGNVFFPATVRQGHLQISVSTTGASPMLTKKLKETLASQFDVSWKTYTKFLFESRNMIKTLPLSTEEKTAWLRELLNDQYRVQVSLQKKELAKIKSLKENLYEKEA